KGRHRSPICVPWRQTSIGRRRFQPTLEGPGGDDSGKKRDGEGATPNFPTARIRVRRAPRRIRYARIQTELSNRHWRQRLSQDRDQHDGTYTGSVDYEEGVGAPLRVTAGGIANLH